MTGLKACYHKTRNLFISFACTYAVIGSCRKQPKQPHCYQAGLVHSRPLTQLIPLFFHPRKVQHGASTAFFPLAIIPGVQLRPIQSWCL